MSSVTIANPLSDQITLEAVPLALIEERDVLVEQAELHAREILSDDAHASADLVFKQVQRFITGLKNHRLAITRPIDALKKALIDAGEDAVKPLEYAKDVLSKAIMAYETQRNARIAELNRKREEERKRLQAEEDAKANEARLLAQAEAEANAAPGEAPAEISVVEHLPAKVEVVSAPLLKSSVKKNYSYAVAVDKALLPRQFMGQDLWIPNEELLLKLAKLELEIPGVTLIKTESLGSKAVR